MYMYMYMYMYLYENMYLYVYINMYIYICIYIFIHTNICIYMYIYKYAHTYIYIYICVWCLWACVLIFFLLLKLSFKRLYHALHHFRTDPSPAGRHAPSQPPREAQSHGLHRQRLCSRQGLRWLALGIPWVVAKSPSKGWFETCWNPT